MNPLAKYAQVLLACNDPTTLRKLFNQLAVSNPDAILNAATEIGLVGGVMKIPSIIGFPLEYIDVKLFTDVKAFADAGKLVEAIKLLRTTTGCGLKEGKDFVVHFFPNYGGN